jgi:uncharacterized membrane protein
MRTWELCSVLLAALMAGMFFGPWAALSRSLDTFEPGVFLAIVNRMNRNMAPVMIVLMPAAMLSIIPVLIYSHGVAPRTFYFFLAGFVLFIVALLVTVVVEVPIVEKICTWTPATLPGDWQQVRDRWQAFHVVRVVAGLVGLVFLLLGTIF